MSTDQIRHNTAGSRWVPSALTARDLVAQGFYQVSRRYHLVARLPEGKTGKQALLDAVRGQRADAERWVNLLGEGHAGDHYLRIYAKAPDLIEVSEATFREFLRIGGGQYRGRR